MAQRTCLTIIGAGGMGVAIARRLGSGQRVVLADFALESLDRAAESLRSTGHQVETQLVDVADFASVTSLAKLASSAGELKTVVNTAGLSPVMAPAKRIYEVDLLGTVNVLDAFLAVMGPGSTLISVASMAGHMAAPSVSAELEDHLATAPRDQLLSHAGIDVSGSSAEAYGISKWGNILRVKAAIGAAGAKGVRVNTISPGIIGTAMVQKELESQAGETIRGMIQATPAQRAGTADDIASVVAFLASADASFITGSDLLVDGGFTAAQRFSSV